VEIHHIVPEAEGGLNDEENAAPLCPSCHAWFGANPEKRKEMRQMRDWWYEVCESKYGGGENETLRKLDEFLTEVRRAGSLQEQHQAIEEIRVCLKRLVDDAGLGEVDPAKAIASKVNAVVTATTLARGVHANVHCKKCGTVVGLLVGSDTCPTCGAPI